MPEKRESEAQRVAAQLKAALDAQIKTVVDAPPSTDAAGAGVNARAIAAIIKAVEGLNALNGSEESAMHDEEIARRAQLRADLERRLARLITRIEAKGLSGQPDAGGDGVSGGGLGVLGTDGAEGTAG